MIEREAMTAGQAMEILKDLFNDSWPPPTRVAQALARLEEVASLERVLDTFDIDMSKQGPTEFFGRLWHDGDDVSTVVGEDYPHMCSQIHDSWLEMINNDGFD